MKTFKGWRLSIAEKRSQRLNTDPKAYLHALYCCSFIISAI